MASLVSGPVAMTTSPSGMASASACSTVIFGCAQMRSVISRANASRSTASAPPAATRLWSALASTTESSRRSSSLSRPTAFVSSSLRRELEQTSSAKFSDTCAGVIFWGFISIRRTGMPRPASCHAHSHPARPAPITVTGVIAFLLEKGGRSGRLSNHASFLGFVVFFAAGFLAAVFFAAGFLAAGFFAADFFAAGFLVSGFVSSASVLGSAASSAGFGLRL